MWQRIAMLDCARGIAILGILLMNITAFGLPKAAYLNPAYAGSITRGEAWTWAVLDMVAQVKFLTLFELLFGGGARTTAGLATAGSGSGDSGQCGAVTSVVAQSGGKCPSLLPGREHHYGHPGARGNIVWSSMYFAGDG